MKVTVSLLLVPVVAVLFTGILSGPACADDDIPVATTYQVYCSRCHGDTGHGDGADGATLSPKPFDFADPALMSKLSDATIVKAIKDGGAGVGLSANMPAWGEALDDKKIKALATYVRAFCKKK